MPEEEQGTISLTAIKGFSILAIAFLSIWEGGATAHATRLHKPKYFIIHYALALSRIGLRLALGKKSEEASEGIRKHC